MNSDICKQLKISEYARRFTPNHIDSLKPNQVFVFGSNSAGAHYGGAARTAVQKFGAIMGQGEGLQGQSYAIPTMGTMGETVPIYSMQNTVLLMPEKEGLMCRLLVQ